MSDLEAKRREFREEYTGTFRAGITILGANEDIPIEMVRIMRAFLMEGYLFFIEKYAKEGEVPTPEWMVKEAATYGLKG